MNQLISILSRIQATIVAALQSKVVYGMICHYKSHGKQFFLPQLMAQGLESGQTAQICNSRNVS